MKQTSERANHEIDGITAIIRRTILAMMTASILLLVCGVTQYLAKPQLQETVHTLADYRMSLLQYHPLGLLFAGLTLLVLSPVAGVLAATIAFLARGDRRYALVALGVLLIVLTTLFLSR